VTARPWLAAGLVLAAACALLWRSRPAGRWHMLFGRPRRRARVSPFLPSSLPEGRSRLAVVGLAALAGLVGVIAAGPVAGIVATTYAALGARAALTGLRTRARTLAHARAVEAVGMLAADLRAGLPLLTAVEAAREAVDPATDVAARVNAALAVADRTGAPVADVLDRLDHDLRSATRLRATITAQAAGSRASAWLLAVLPVAGVALGPLVGADNGRVLLHTSVGAACVCLAVVLQLGGLAWSSRLVRTVP
jgi:tight adherence protein B